MQKTKKNQNFTSGGFGRKMNPYYRVPENEIFNKTPHIIEKSESGWYRVILTNVSEYNKAEILNKLSKIAMPFEIESFGWHVCGKETIFFVNNVVVAKRLARLKDYASIPCGISIQLSVDTKLGITHVADEHKNLLSVAVAKCYESEHNVLNLSQFYKNKILENYFSPLFVPEIMEIVFYIVGSKFKLITNLNLSSNNISDLKVLARYSDVLRNLQTIDLTNNTIRTVNELKYLSDFALNDIKLADNPVNNNSTRYEIYKMLPMLQHLNGFAMDLQIPAAKQYSLCNPDGKEFVESFMQQFFLNYDTNRDNLIKMYASNAKFSLNIPNNSNSLNEVTSYKLFNRNMLGGGGSSFALNKKLISGNLNIVNLLKRLPDTKHANNLSYNLMIYESNIRQIIFNGFFFETTSKSEVVKRSFNRCILLNPLGLTSSMWAISNDTLTITECSQEDLVQDSKPKPTDIIMPKKALEKKLICSAADTDDNEKERQLLNEIDETETDDDLDMRIDDGDEDWLELGGCDL